MQIINDTLLIDTLKTAIHVLPHDVTIHEPLWRYIFTGICGIATIIIAVVNIYYVLKLHKKHDIKEQQAKERERKLALLKTLLLDHNLQYLYKAFEEIEKHLLTLKNKDCDRKVVEKNIQAELKTLSEKFIFLLSAFNTDLYKSVLKVSDELRDTLVTNLSDEGILFTVEAKYSELISKPFKEAKKEMLQTLFDYKGD